MTKLNQQLVSLVNACFEKKGAIESLGGRYNEQQHKYAVYLADAISNPSQAMIEADTGIGKGLGYLIPSLIYLNLLLAKAKKNQSRKIVVSTFTRALQKQLIEADLPFVVKVLAQIGIENKAKCALRMGRAAFFSLERVSATLAHIRDSNKTNEVLLAELDEFENFAFTSCSVGSGLWLDWLDLHSAFPTGVTADDICLVPNQIIDNAAYENHLLMAKNANLLITNHMTIAARAIKFESGSIEALICDEAHEIEAVCMSLFNFRKPIYEISNTIKEVHESNLGLRGIHKDISNIEAWVSELKKKNEKINERHWTTFNCTELLTQQNNHVLDVRKLVIKCEKHLAKASETGNVSTKHNALANDVQEIKRSIEQWLNPPSAYSQSAISFSKVRNNPALGNINLYAGRIFYAIVRDMTQRVILTSATMSDATHLLAFKGICTTLGFLVANNTCEVSLTPSNYGKMSFKLCKKDTPTPIIVNSGDSSEAFTFNETWVKNTVDMIVSAGSYDRQATLVLTNSFAEAALFGAKLKELDIDCLVHKKGHVLSEYIPAYREQNTILITPSAWQGFSPRQTDLAQLTKHVVITRIPFSPPNDLFDRIRSHVAKTHAANNSQAVGWLNQATATIAKLRQGIGRGIRSPNDEVTVWVCDSRIHSISNLKKAIPIRFHDAFLSAELFCLKSKNSKDKEPSLNYF